MAGGCPGYGNAEHVVPEVTLQKRMTRMAGACPGFGSAEHVEDDKGPAAIAKPETDPVVSYLRHASHLFYAHII